MTANPRRHVSDSSEDDDLVPKVIHMSPDEARVVFDENARYWLNMSGEEFLRKWRNHEFGDIDTHPDHVRIMEVASLLPFVAESQAEQ